MRAKTLAAAMALIEAADREQRIMAAERAVIDAVMAWWQSDSVEALAFSQSGVEEACAALNTARKPAPTGDGTGAEEG